MRDFAAEHAADKTSNLTPKTGSGAANKEQLAQKAGTPSALGTLTTAQRAELAKRLNAALGKDAFEPAGVQCLVTDWLALEKRFGWNADNVDIVNNTLSVLDVRAAKIKPADDDRPDDKAMRRQLALQIMTFGSLNMSRTVRYAKPFTRVGLATKTAADANRIAARNFERAAKLVVDDAASLPLSFETAAKLNYILTKDLLPTGAGKLNHGEPGAIYKWLASEEAKELMASDPVAVAEKIHYELSRLDQFTDGNGRTARLMADLALVKGGRAPAYYTDIENYFLRGNSRADVSRESKVNYYRHIAARGEALINRARKAAEARYDSTR